MSQDSPAEAAADRPTVSLNHVGQTVPDVHAAVEWYRDVLGFEVVLYPTTVSYGESELADRFAEIVGEFEEVTMAQLRADGGRGIELFEYQSATSEGGWDRRATENWPHTPGINHLALTCEDVDSVVQRVTANGGTEYTELRDTDSTVRTAYLLDPWDNVVEVSSHTFDQLVK